MTKKTMPKPNTLAQAKYDKENVVRYSLKLNKNTDKEVIEIIENTSKVMGLTKQQTIKSLILKNKA